MYVLHWTQSAAPIRCYATPRHKCQWHRISLGDQACLFLAKEVTSRVDITSSHLRLVNLDGYALKLETWASSPWKVCLLVCWSSCLGRRWILYILDDLGPWGEYGQLGEPESHDWVWICYAAKSSSGYKSCKTEATRSNSGCNAVSLSSSPMMTERLRLLKPFTFFIKL